MNRFSKTATWVAASLLAAVSAFADNSNCACPPMKGPCEPGRFYEQGHELVCTNLPAAYNAPARIEVKSSWDMYFSGAFTYWQAIQDNMELGLVGNAPADTSFVNGNVVNMDFGYKPGFKVGFGMDFDHDKWEFAADYTWFRGTSTTSTSESSGSGYYVLPMWGSPDIIDLLPSGTFTSGSESWKLSMDLVDAELARSCYEGKYLSFRPFFGARGAWIRQNISVSYLDSSLNSYDINGHTNSWAVGPRAGLDTNWMIGQGFRLYGNSAGDILYTRYTSLRENDSQSTSAGVLLESFVTTQKNLGCLRTHLELEMGIGWGSYFDNNNWHVDLSAGYNFQVFFDQNAFRRFYQSGTGTTVDALSFLPNGNLYLQGLTATLNVDF